MSTPSRPRDPLQQHVSATILLAAARAIASRGDGASMGDVAAEAGVARGTLYRYFPSRRALEEAVVEAGLGRAEEGLRAGRIEELGVGDGMPRAVRALLDVGDSLVVILRRRAGDPHPGFDARVAGPLRRLLRGGQDSGEIRADVPAAWLTESLLSLIAGAVSSPPATGREDTIAAVSDFFLTGAGIAPRGRSGAPGTQLTAGGHHD